MFSVNRRDFGPNFIVGAATAAYQIEGGQTDGRGGSYRAFQGMLHNTRMAESGAGA